MPSAPPRSFAQTELNGGRGRLVSGGSYATTPITDLFAAFDKIEGHGVASRPIPAEFAVDGFYFRHEHHFVYWRRLSNGDVGIVTILHERMHQMDRFRDDLGG